MKTRKIALLFVGTLIIGQPTIINSSSYWYNPITQWASNYKTHLALTAGASAALYYFYQYIQNNKQLEEKRRLEREENERNRRMYEEHLKIPWEEQLRIALEHERAAKDEHTRKADYEQDKITIQKDYNPYFETLGLSPTATYSDVKKAYHRLAQKYHPDKNKSPKATKIMAAVNNAYENLEQYFKARMNVQQMESRTY